MAHIDTPDLPALDTPDVDPDSLALGPAPADHDLDVDAFEVDEQSDRGIIIEGDR